MCLLPQNLGPLTKEPQIICQVLFSPFSFLLLINILKNVKLADGTLTIIGGKVNIQISPSLTLSSILHVSNLSSNLLSVRRLTKNPNCSVMFFPIHCVIHDLRTRTLIGVASEEKGLYVFHSRNLEKFIENCILVNEENKYK